MPLKKSNKTLIQIDDGSDIHQCEFCKRTFIRENTFFSHACEKRRRWLRKEDPEVRLGFNSWLRFYELNTKTKKENKRTFRDFIDSRYYIAFIKFGRYVIESKVINSDKYLDFLIKNTVPIDDWVKDSFYQVYIEDLLRSESPENALRRNIELMHEWSCETGESLNDFFTKVNPLLATSWIISGKISPWVLYNSENSKKLFDRCGEEQLQLIVDRTKPHLWKLRFEHNKDGTNWIKKTLQEAGI